MIQVNRKTQHITEYTPYYIIYAHEKKTKKEKDNREMKRKYFK